MRKVILEVVEPLTRKQFHTFDGIDDMRKKFTNIENKYEETVIKLERILRRNEAIDRMEKHTKEIVNIINDF